MAASSTTCYHEAGHAFVTLRMGMLHEHGIILNSNEDAYTCVIEAPDGSEEWCIRRSAVKLAGPIGGILQQGHQLDWDVLRDTGEYHKDYVQGLVGQLCGGGATPH